MKCMLVPSLTARIFSVWNMQEKLIKEYQPKCKETLAGFEKWLSKRKWFAGDKVSTQELSQNARYFCCLTSTETQSDGLSRRG